MKKLIIAIALALSVCASPLFAAQQTITGGSGVSWLQEYTKLNSNFTELYGFYTDAEIDTLLAGKLDADGSAFVMGGISDLRIKDTAQPSTGTNLILDTAAHGATDDEKHSWSISKIGGFLVAVPFEMCAAASDESTALTVADDKVNFRVPVGLTLTEVRASVVTAPTGAALTVDVEDDGTTVFSTLLTIDVSERTSTTAATPAVINAATIADDSEITVNVDLVGSTIAGAGLKVCLIGTRSIM